MIFGPRSSKSASDGSTISVRLAILSSLGVFEQIIGDGVRSLARVQRHCDEQMKTVREKYVRDKENMAREVGDLEGQRAQLVKAIKKLESQQVQLKDRATGASA